MGTCCSSGVLDKWDARKIKSLPLTIKEVAPELVEAKRKWERMNFSTDTILDLVDQIPDKSSEVKDKSTRSWKNLQKL